MIPEAQRLALLESAWGEVLDASERLPAATARAMRARIDDDVAAFVAEHRHALAKAPALKAWMDAGAQPEKARSLGKELDRLLAAFPGDARLWGVRSQVYLRDKGDVARAWEANRRALSLAPDDTLHQQQELFLIPRHLAPADAERRLDAVYAELVRGEANTEVCFGFIAAAMALARRRRDRKRLLQMALDAASVGFGLPPLSPQDRAMFRAMQLIARALLAGHTPGLDVLYRAGLGVWAAGMAAGADPLEVLTEHWSPLRYARAA